MHWQTSTTQSVEDLARELGTLTADLPTLIALPILLNAYVFTSEKGGPRSIPSILGLPEERYRLTGFVRAEECTAVVGQRVLDVLSKRTGAHIQPRRRGGRPLAQNRDYTNITDKLDNHILQVAGRSSPASLLTCVS